jgi:hypothetical protein
MLDSDFWRELAINFQSVPALHEFSAFRHYYMELRYFSLPNNLEPIWKVEATPPVLAEFHALAVRSATMLPPLHVSDLVITWLEALWKEATEGPVRSGIPIIGKDRTGKLTELRGKIDRVFEASFTLCRKFEAVALQSEFQEKQRSDSKNWPILQQELEARRQLKNLLAGPPETITEEFAREAIARQKGIRPEDVTPMQIRSEVSSLLRVQPVIYIPATKQSDSPKSQATESTDATDPKFALTTTAEETVAAQIKSLRDECRWTNEQLAEAADLSARQVARHVSGEAMPYKRNIAAYERLFSNELKRKIVIIKKS